LAGISLLVSAWALLLRTQVRRKTELIRQRLEKEAQLEQLFRGLVENANDLICTLDQQGRFTSLNRAGESILGFSRAELNAKRLEELLVPGSSAVLQNILSAAPGHPHEGVLELKILHRSGSQRILEADSRPIAGVGVQIIARDVTERKKTEAELAAMQSQLLDVSRQAGMAEVATAILHNVGNVLNSINVSATLVSDRCKQLGIASLAQLAQLLQEHSADMGDFMMNHPKGRLVPGFDNRLAEHLAREQSAMLLEIGCLRNNLEHVKAIVATQQNYAKVGGVIEQANPAQLVEDALRINANMLQRRQVRVIRQYDAERLPKISVDRHQVLQILINLVRNAAFACEESGRPDRCLALSITRCDARIQISLIDNGVGIAPENLTRIFHHGFTTRKDGHGFGLHSGALAAKEMGGDLRGGSDGVGKGASFTLELPLQARPAAS
jgi:PAS domain S-box-containing protein